MIEGFLKELDARWAPLGGEPYPLRFIGSAALMLQTNYARGTKDGDVLEARETPPAATERLEALAGRGSDLAVRNKLYIDVVKESVLFLPQKPAFHPHSGVSLRNFSVETLDVVDVVVSKLKRYNADDADDAGDILAMAQRGLIDSARLVERFKAAVDWFDAVKDARIADLPRYLKNLHPVERDILGVPVSDIELPESAD